VGVIYKITSPSNKVYVGKTYDLRKRINAHKCATKYGKNILLHNSIRKYGWDAHSLEIIEEVEDVLMNEREVYWVERLKTYCYENKQGLNMTKGGEGQRSTWMHKTELRSYFSKKFSGSGNPFHGRSHSVETKKVISEKASLRNRSNGIRIPEWGAEKGRDVVRKKVLCYDFDGKFISEYKSVTEASNELNLSASSICAHCKGGRTNVGGFVFRYKTMDEYPTKIDVGEIKRQSIKRPVLLLSENYETITEYSSAKEASEFWGIPKGTINRAAMYNYLVPIRAGHIFIYKDLLEEILEVENSSATTSSIKSAFLN
jgi:group I intron endonuclease